MDNTKIYDLLYGHILRQRFLAGKELFSSLEKQKIPYAVHKGAVLSTVLYGDPAKKQSGDVDLLVPREYIDEIKNLFRKCGFVQARVIGNLIEPYSRADIIFQATQSHQMAPFVKAIKNKLCPFVEYDCNIDIFWGESQKHIDMNDFLKNCETITLYDVTIRKLTPEAEFIALCMHHYKDLNSIYLLWTRGYDVNKLREISAYVHTNTINIDKLFVLCQKYCVSDYVCYCVHFANCVSKSNLLTILESHLETKESRYLYSCFGLCNDERKQWSVDFNTRCTGKTRNLIAPLLSDNDIRKIKANTEMM